MENSTETVNSNIHQFSMIISHKYEFIFIKNRKTASTSIEIALSKYCGKDDTITSIEEKDEAIREKLGYLGPQNILLPISQINLTDWAKILLGNKSIRFRNHMSASVIKRHINPKIWDSYYKFCFERNPWDKVISKHNYRKYARKMDLEPINEFVKSEMIYEFSDFHLYSDNNKILVDDVFKYENINAALRTISEKIGLPEIPALPNAKKGIRKQPKNYREVFNEESKEIISKIFAREIEYFNYRW